MIDENAKPVEDQESPSIEQVPDEEVTVIDEEVPEPFVPDVEVDEEVVAEPDVETPSVMEYPEDEHRDEVSPYAAAEDTSESEDTSEIDLIDQAVLNVLAESPDTPLTEEEYLDPVAHNITIEKDCHGPLPADFSKNTRHYISVLRNSIEEVNRLSERYPQFDNIPKGEDQWSVVAREAFTNFVTVNSFLASLSKETSHWLQAVEVEGVRLAAGAPKISSQGENGKLTGDAAMFQVLGALSLGSIVQIPLWHSGVWVSIKAPTDSELLLLDQALGDIKISLGNMASGLVYSNTSVYMINHLVNFALDHVYDSSLKDSRPENLKKMLRVTDIPILIWGLCCAIYPNGYPHRRPCVSDPNKCQHIEETMLYLPRLCWTDREALTHSQKKHMINRRAKHSNEHVMLYQNDLKYGQKRTVEFTPKLKMVLRVPNIEEYIISGFNWIDGVVNMIEENFGTSATGEERDNRILAQGNITMLRQYAHWIDKILVTSASGEESYIDSSETINKVLATITGQESLREKFFKHIGEYIDYATISLIGIPRYTCPNCGKPQGDVLESAHKYIIPLDIVNIFFTLQRRRIILGR